MKYLIILSLLSFLTSGFHHVAEVNQLKADGQQAFLVSDFRKSSKIFTQLIEEYKIEDEVIRMNLAHSLFKNNERKKAETHYLLLIHSTNFKIKATAYQQLGVLMGMKGKNQQAINYFIQCLKIDPYNEKARYNYELLKKIQELEVDPQKEKRPGGKDGNKKQKGNSENNGNIRSEQDQKNISPNGNNQTSLGNSEGDITRDSESGKEKGGMNATEDNGDEKRNSDQGDQQKQAMRAHRLSQMNLSEDRAKMILEAMKNEEIQYLQQIKRNTRNKNYINKPDW